MKKTLFVALALIASGAFSTAYAAKKDKKAKKTETVAETVKLNTKSDSLSYAAGMARTDGLLPYLKQNFGVEESDMADFLKGYEDVLKQGMSNKVKAYAAGQQIALMVDGRMLPYLKEEFKNAKDSINGKLFNEGFIAALKKDNSVFADSVAKPYFEKAVKANIEAENQKTKKIGEAFLAQNAKKEGVVVLPSGLQYKVIKEGEGRMPELTDKVKCHYEGTFVDGEKFDSSYDRKQPAVFGVNQVIPGWTEALQLMSEGSVWELYIPYKLGYGEAGAQGAIPPYSALVFKVELIEVL